MPKIIDLVVVKISNKTKRQISRNEPYSSVTAKLAEIAAKKDMGKNKRRYLRS